MVVSAIQLIVYLLFSTKKKHGDILAKIHITCYINTNLKIVIINYDYDAACKIALFKRSLFNRTAKIVRRGFLVNRICLLPAVRALYA